MNKLFILIILFLSFQQLSAQNFPKSNDKGIHKRSVDIDTIKLDITINPWKETVGGRAKINFRPLLPKVDSFFIHCVNFNIKEVILNKTKAHFKYLPEGGIWIYPNKIFKGNNTLEIEYSAKPKKGMYFVGWNDKTNRRKKQIWTQGQGIDNRYWFPSYDLQDDKTIFDLQINFPKNYNLLSNGELISKTTDSISTTWNYKTTHPMSSYLIMIAGGEYNLKYNIIGKRQRKQGNIAFEYWYYKGQDKYIEPTYIYTEEIMSFFESEIGVDYPWKKYAQIPVSDFKHGAMENTTATIFSDAYFCNDSSFVDRNYISVNAHEMAHQWFGDAITCTSAKHHWLHEGFATYYQLKAIEKFIGEEDYLWEKKSYREQILHASLRDSLPLLHPKAGTERFYYKGAFLLMMLEQKIGTKNFNKAINQYVQENMYGVIESEDFINSIQNTLNIDLTSFFDQWLYKSGEPQIEVSYFDNGTKKGIIFNQTSKIFNLNIPVTIKYKRRKTNLNFTLNKKTDTLFIKKRISHFEIDPKIESLANYSIFMPYDFLKSQIVNASTPVKQLEALEKISWIDEDEKLQIFSKINIDKGSAKVINRVYSLLERDSSEISIELKHKILSKHNIELRKLIVSEKLIINESEKQFYEDFLNTKSYELIASSLNLLCKNFPDDTNHFLDKTKNIIGSPIPIVKLSWLENAITFGNFNDSVKKEYANNLVDYCSSSFEFNTRLLALTKLLNISYFNKNLLLNLIDGATSFNHRLVGPFRRILSEMSKNESFRNELLNISRQENLSSKERLYLNNLLGIINYSK